MFLKSKQGPGQGRCEVLLYPFFPVVLPREGKDPEFRTNSIFVF